MTNFYLDVSNFKKNIDKLKSLGENFDSDISKIYFDLKYIDGAWRGADSIAFQKRLISDRNVMEKEFEYINIVLREMSFFCDRICAILKNHGYDDKDLKLKFNDSYMYNLRNYFNNTYYYLNKALSKININRDSLYLNSYYIYSLKNSINNVKTYMSDTLSGVEGLVSSLNTAVSESKVGMKKVEQPAFNLTVPTYNWSLVKANLTAKDEKENFIDSLQK